MVDSVHIYYIIVLLDNFRSIRQCNGGEHTVIVGILKQSYLEKEELSVISHLNAGIDKLLPDINSRAYWSNEIVQLVHGPVKSASRSERVSLQRKTSLQSQTTNETFHFSY